MQKSDQVSEYELRCSYTGPERHPDFSSGVWIIDQVSGY